MASARETEDEFMGRMFQLVCDGHLCLSVAMGTHTGLFEKMAEWDQPKSSQEIAQAANLKERYVREWLGAMVTGKIVDITTDTSGVDQFVLPPHRRTSLTKAGGTNNSAAISVNVPALAEVFGKITNCFTKDGPKGVSYSDYSDMLWKSMDNMTEDKCNKHLVADVIPEIPGMSKALESGVSVLDIGCGPGATSIILATEFPNSIITALDMCDEALELLKSKATIQKLKNITVIKRDASRLPSDWAGKFDFIVARDMVHDAAHPDDVLRCCFEALKMDGTFVMTDVHMHTSMTMNIPISHAPMSYTWSLFNCMPVSLNEDGMGLGSAWGIEKAAEMVKAAGFTKVTFKRCPSEGTEALFICRKV